MSEQLAEVERLAGLMFGPAEICTILGVAGEEPATPAFEQALLRGRLLAEAEIRKSIIDLAKAGSSPAQALAVDLINQSRVATAGE